MVERKKKEIQNKIPRPLSGQQVAHLCMSDRPLNPKFGGGGGGVLGGGGLEKKKDLHQILSSPGTAITKRQLKPHECPETANKSGSLRQRKKECRHKESGNE